MSYRLPLPCGCMVYVACHPKTGIAHKRVIETKGPSCAERRHRRAERLWLWEMLPDPRHAPAPEFVDCEAGAMSVP